MTAADDPVDPEIDRLVRETAEKLITEGLQPAWRQGFSQGLECTGDMVEAVLATEELPDLTQATLHGILSAIRETQGKILDETQTPAPSGWGAPAARTVCGYRPRRYSTVGRSRGMTC